MALGKHSLSVHHMMSFNCSILTESKLFQTRLSNQNYDQHEELFRQIFHHDKNDFRDDEDRKTAMSETATVETAVTVESDILIKNCMKLSLNFDIFEI